MALIIIKSICISCHLWYIWWTTRASIKSLRNTQIFIWTKIHSHIYIFTRIREWERKSKPACANWNSVFVCQFTSHLLIGERVCVYIYAYYVYVNMCLINHAGSRELQLATFCCLLGLHSFRRKWCSNIVVTGRKFRINQLNLLLKFL